MKYIALSFFLAISFLILMTSVHAEFLRTDILKKFYPFPITGAVVEATEGEETTTVEEVTTTLATTTIPKVEVTTTVGETTTTILLCPTMPTCDPDDPCFSGWDICGITTTTLTKECRPLECLLYCEYGYKKDSQGCEICECNPEPECPRIPESCWCPDGTVCPEGKDEQGCPIWLPDECPFQDICPPAPIGMPYCPEGEYPETVFDEKGCPIGKKCVPRIRNETIDCPEKQTCPDGSTVPCYIKDNTCICELCPITEENIPEGCWQEADEETGTIHIICGEKTCLEIPKVKELVDRCEKSGGKPIIKTNPNGCDYLDCLFGDETDPDPFDDYEECPSPEEIERVIKKCKNAGLSPAISFEGGCKIVECTGEEEEICKILTAGMRLKIEEQCAEKGLKAIKDYDENGCPYFACAGEEFCKKELIGEAFEKCKIQGGEMVIKKDDMGCIVYSECVERGDKRNIYVDPIEEIPEPTELLDVAFKLEQLKVELDKLAREADDIADYYASVGDPDEHRFRRVSSMFNAIIDEIDEIKNELRENLDTLTPEDMERVRFEIRSVKESLKDIVYVMLSNSDDVKEIIEAEATPPEIPVEGSNCGTDVECFENAFRVCKPVTFMPEGSAGPIATIKGLEGDACVLRVEAPKNAKLPDVVVDLVGSVIYMECKITKYSLGAKSFESDILPYCEGPMKKLAEIFGTEALQEHTKPEQEFIGPDGCSNEKECKQVCEMNPDACIKWCEANPGNCPFEAGVHLKELKEGIDFVMCTPEDEMKMKECSKNGGYGQSDPRKPPEVPERCEVYTGCLMPAMGRCDCAREEGCTVVCSDYSYGQMNCEKHLADGCVWVVGGVEVQPCTGCLNNGVCDVGECSECVDCL